MKYLKDTRIILGLLFIVALIILEIGKSIRIDQLKEVEESKIESIGNYEEKSKNEYLKVIDSDKTIDE